MIEEDTRRIKALTAMSPATAMARPRLTPAPALVYLTQVGYIADEDFAPRMARIPNMR